MWKGRPVGETPKFNNWQAEVRSSPKETVPLFLGRELECRKQTKRRSAGESGKIWQTGKVKPNRNRPKTLKRKQEPKAVETPSQKK